MPPRKKNTKKTKAEVESESTTIVTEQETIVSTTDDTESDQVTTKKQKITKTSVKKTKAAPVKKTKAEPKTKSTKGSSKKGKGKRKKTEDDEEDEEQEETKETTVSVTTTTTTTTTGDIEMKTTSEEKTITLTSHTIPSSSPIKSILSWNVNGIRAALKKDRGGIEYLKKMDADIICLTEIKVDTPAQAGVAPIYPYMYWNPCIAQKGYAGTALWSKIKPIKVTNGLGIEKHDDEGRVITAEYEHFYLVNTYVPNSGQKLERLDYRVKEWDLDMFAYLQKLQQTKPVIWTGDLNVAHLEIDIHSPKTNRRSAGFTPQERESFGSLLATGFVDSFRHLYPTAEGYTYWSHKRQGRENNNGWRLDYFILSPSLIPLLHDVIIESELTDDKQRRSDHAPLLLKLK